jgi:diguanylate cyclase (GGDEF)-like protein
MKISEPEFLQAKILIVDDQPSNVSLLEELLHQVGYTAVSSTTNPVNVGSLHRANQFDLILLDLQMPVMSGFEVLEELKLNEADVYPPVLVITAQPNHKLRALQAGARDFISKPFDLIEVKTRIRNMLEVCLLYKKLARSNRDLASLALHDELTGLPNRRLLMDRLRRAQLSSDRTTKHAALMFLDLDHFKQLNDSQGHQAGDAMLRQVATQLNACVREGDSVARLGGDEFVVLLEALSPDKEVAAVQARSVVNKILALFQPNGDLNSDAHSCTLSVGVLVFKGKGESLDALFQQADVAMYQAKLAGRNTARFYDPTRVDAG